MKFTTAKRLYKYLEALHACDGALEACLEARDEWKATRPCRT
jgi:hypothetical protein